VSLVASVAIVAKIIELPFESWFSGRSPVAVFSSPGLVSLMSSLGYISLFALMTLESASLPIPSEVVLPFSGYLVYLGVMNFGLALGVSTVAALVGALVDYYAAFLLGRAFVERFLSGFGIKKSALERAERWFRRRGPLTIFVARFAPLVRSIISLPAGLFKMPLMTFSLYTVLGCGIWNAALIYAGYTAGGLWESVVGSSLSFGVNLLFSAIAAGSAIYLGFYAYALGREWHG